MFIFLFMLYVEICLIILIYLLDITASLFMESRTILHLINYRLFRTNEFIFFPVYLCQIRTSMHKICITYVFCKVWLLGLSFNSNREYFFKYMRKYKSLFKFQ